MKCLKNFTGLASTCAVHSSHFANSANLLNLSKSAKYAERLHTAVTSAKGQTDILEDVMHTMKFGEMCNFLQKMRGAAPVLKILFSQVPCFDNQCILALCNNDNLIRLIRGLGVLSTNALDIIGWLHVLCEKSPMIIQNYVHLHKPCTLFIFDPKREDYSHFVNLLIDRGLLEDFVKSIGVTDTNEFADFMKNL